MNIFIPFERSFYFENYNSDSTTVTSFPSMSYSRDYVYRVDDASDNNIQCCARQCKFQLGEDKIMNNPVCSIKRYAYLKISEVKFKYK